MAASPHKRKQARGLLTEVGVSASPRIESSRIGGYLAQGVTRASGEMPYPDLPDPVKRLIAQAIRIAWNDLNHEVGADIYTFAEPEITVLLHRNLNQMRFQGNNPPGFSSSIFETIVRDASEFSYDGAHLDKRPDLAFRLQSRTPGFSLAAEQALFVECKIVDEPTHVRLYCLNGINRFILGEYAWAMPSGMLVAYSRGDQNIETHLRSFLEKESRQALDKYVTESLPTTTEALCEASNLDVQVSRHKRNWLYPGTNKNPGSISLIHLWLQLGRRTS